MSKCAALLIFKKAICTSRLQKQAGYHCYPYGQENLLLLSPLEACILFVLMKCWLKQATSNVSHKGQLRQPVGYHLVILMSQTLP